MSKLFRLLRVKQWIKNSFIFLPAFFGGKLSFENFSLLVIGFIVFSLIASSIYIINDINDAELDRKHPKKKFRPIASKEVSVLNGIIISVVLLVASLLLSYFLLPPLTIWIIVGYFLLNLGYSVFLKNISIVDLLIVSLGFVFRIVFGSEIIFVELSYWLLLMTFLFSVFIVIAKRRDDFTASQIPPYQLRKVNKHYNLSFLNITLSIISALMMVCYIMYTVDSKYFESRPYFALFSSILVILGLIRYFQAIYVEENGGSPTDFALKDVFIRVVVLIWVLIFCYLIYF